MSHRTHAAEPPSRVDVAFPLTGTTVPAEHGHALFGALCRRLGDLHGAAWLAVHPLRGALEPDGSLSLRRHNLALRLRIDPAQLPRVLPLAGASLLIEGHAVRVRGARVFALAPADTLAARMVVLLRGATRERFDAALARRLEAMGVHATVEVPGDARVLRIREQRIVGFPVVLRGLSAADSLRVQAVGVGRQQRFGCGVFSPLREGGR